MEPQSPLSAISDFLGTHVVFIGDYVLTLLNLILAALTLGLAWAAARWAKGLATRVFSAESEEEAGVAGIAEPVAYWTVMGLGILLVLHFLGVDIATGRDVLNAELFSIGGESPVSLFTLLFAAVVVALTWVLSRLMRRALDRAFRSRQIDEGTTATSKRLIHYAVMVTGIMLALSNLGVNLGAFFAAGAVFAVGFGFAMQNIAQNFVSGLILLIERSIKPGDVLEVDTMVVVVEKMGIRSTVARTRDEEEIIIPNSTLVQNSVKNYTLRDSLFRVRSSVGVEYSSDIRQVMATLRATAEAIDWRFPGRDPVVHLKAFADSSVNFEVSVWMHDPWTAPLRQSELNQAIWFALKDASITIAFPQLDVHFDEPIEKAAHSLPRAS